jgi:hypothetical protein
MAKKDQRKQEQTKLNDPPKMVHRSTHKYGIGFAFNLS